MLLRFRGRRKNTLVIVTLTMVVYLFICTFPSVPPYLRRTQHAAEPSELARGFHPDRNSVLIVTACNMNHFMYLNYLLYSLRELNAWVIFYDIGLDPSQKKNIIYWPRLLYRSFHFDKYPAYFNVNVKAGEYAWKPVIVSDTMNEFKMDTLWIDAAGYFKNNCIGIVKQRIRDRGVYIGASGGTMRDYTFPAMFKALNSSFDDYASKPNFEAGFIGFRYTVDVMINVVEPWRRCALQKECIAPEGSSRANHRQDQSVITYLLHHAKLTISTDRNLESDCVYIKCDTNFYAFIDLVGRYPNLKLFQWFCI